jgi:photosynthetic reaction center cytochrome c subunit
MKIGIGTYIGGAVAVVAGAFIVFGTFKPPSTVSVQHGYRGTGMDLVYHRAELATKVAENGLPDAIPPSDPSGQKAGTIYKNLKVLGDVDITEFGRIMASMSAWVAPTQSCNYCHSADGNFASDALYTKKVARRMLQMTRHINADWQTHVAKTGVTCYTCHRGQPVPSYVWFNNPGPASGMGIASAVAGDTALPNDPFTPYLENPSEIRVVSKVVLPGTDHQSIKQTEGTYALMMHFSNALGVNCTFCHNTRSFSSWDQSTPQRGTAWYGIRMVRDLNANFLGSLKGVFPSARLGPHGDVPKVDCMTCHQGAYKPLLGAQMAKDYPELLETKDAQSVVDGTPAPDAPAPAEPPKP